MIGMIVDLRDERFRRDIAAMHHLGPRALYELLAELGARFTIYTEIEALVARYARLDPAALAAAGGDQWPPQ